ncbi:hypothetical protein FBZ93_116188 [Bradyrhizobium macuxiense]|uniref:Uncharacterized protein n=1 Tax=Bradyrhizobium macuxiense TaxID=1755647 RepID=A0A560L2G6_9BRAD|nr:hypothetical protein FBZ93_116188 [Bradyrhizobium macuxiense]
MRTLVRVRCLRYRQVRLTRAARRRSFFVEADLLHQTTSWVSDQLLCAMRIINMPGLAQRSANRCMQMLRQVFDDVACLVNLTASDRRVWPKAPADRLRQRLRSANDEDTTASWIEASADQVVGRSLAQSQRSPSRLPRQPVGACVPRYRSPPRRPASVLRGCAARRSGWRADRVATDRTASIQPSAQPTTRRTRHRRFGSAVAKCHRHIALRQANGAAKTCGSRRSAASGSSPTCRAPIGRPPRSAMRAHRRVRAYAVAGPGPSRRGKPSGPSFRPTLAVSFLQPPVAQSTELLDVLFHHPRQRAMPAVRQKWSKLSPTEFAGALPPSRSRSASMS